MKNYLANKMNAVREGMKDNKGFSLVELIIVVAIMAVLMGILAPQYLRFVESSREQTDASAANEVAKAITIALATVEGTHTAESFTWVPAGGALTASSSSGSGSTATTSDFAAEVIATVGDMPTISSVAGQAITGGFKFTITTNSAGMQVPALNSDVFAEKIGVVSTEGATTTP